MSDWTYIPLRRSAAGALGSHAAARGAAMRIVRKLAALPGGAGLLRNLNFTRDLPETEVVVNGTTFASPIGVSVSPSQPGSATVFRSLGFGFACSEDDLPAEAVISEATNVYGLLAELDQGAPLVVANHAVLAEGPSIAQRVNEILAERSRSTTLPEAVLWFRPWTWAAWVWALWLGVAMICGGVGAAVITYGPVLLGYDEEFLGVSVEELRAMNGQLVPFIQHDRVTMAGSMMAIGFNDIGFAFAMRRGWRWARAGFALAGAVGFPTFFLFLGYRFFDPLHFAVATGFFPLYLMGVFGRRAEETWKVPIDVDRNVRHRALYGQILMIALAVGIFVGGLVIMIIGLRDVLIPSDRAFLGDTQTNLAAALDGRLLRFIAHDRAGFGGTLASLGVGLLATSAWGWRSGEKTTWWLLAAASTTGFGSALYVHITVGYTDLLHLSPVYLGVAWVIVALYLSKEWFLADV